MLGYFDVCMDDKIGRFLLKYSQTEYEGEGNEHKNFVSPKDEWDCYNATAHVSEA